MEERKTDVERVAGERICLTGGAGFIGVSLARTLVETNEVIFLDNLWRDSLSGSELERHPNLKLIQGDVLDREAVQKAVDGCTMVVHLAAIAGVDTVIKMPVKTMEVNIIGTANVLAASSRQPRLKRFIDISTSEIFGTSAFKVKDGDVATLGTVGEARWTYAVSKLATEHLALNYHRAQDMPCLAVRPFNIYGPGQLGEGAVHHFVVRALRREDLIIHNDGGQIRAWCYVDDFVRALNLCLLKEEAVGNTFNIGNPRSTLTIYYLARLVRELAQAPVGIQFVPWKYPDVELRIPNIDRARELLGFEPETDLEEGLLRTIAWYRERLGKGRGDF